MRLPLCLSLALCSFTISCQGGTPAAPDTAPAPPDTTQAATDTAADAPKPPPRKRSEPPPRPPLPDGIKRFDKDVITLSLSGDGRYLAGGDLGGRSLLWDLSSGRFLWGDVTPEGTRVGRVAFADSGDIWIGGGFDQPDHPWRAWAAGPMERRGEFGPAGEVAIDLALDHTGATAAVLTSSPDGARQTASVWKLADPSRPRWATTVLESRRGAVAISPDGQQLAVSDDRGGLFRVRLADADPAGQGGTERVTLAQPSQDAVPARFTRLAWLEEGPENGLWAAVEARLMRFAPEDSGPSTTRALADEAHPIRGLHRVKRDAEVTLVAVTRPEAGGLVLWGLDGQAVGELVTDCRCETHALSFDGQTAACGCTPAAEIRYGAVRWR